MYPSRKMVIQYLKFWISHNTIDNWINNKTIFFIFSMGRSGTKFIANLLNKAPNTLIVHEPTRSDFRAYQEAFNSEKKAFKYIHNFRKEEIYLRARKKEISTYGEVNSTLRRHSKVLKQVFPNAIFFHLIRDGRDVVRSMMSRQTMTNMDRNTKKISPLNGDPWKSKWSQMTRFERICWYWAIENQYLNENIKNTIKFEMLISNYDYFKKKLLNPLNLAISKEIWMKEIEIPKNITIKYKISHWKDWDKEQIDKFKLICGEIMKINGYNLSF